MTGFGYCFTMQISSAAHYLYRDSTVRSKKEQDPHYERSASPHTPAKKEEDRMFKCHHTGAKSPPLYLKYTVYLVHHFPTKKGPS